MAIPFTLIETERLVLRELAAADAAFVIELLNAPDFIANIGDRGVRTLDEARAYVETGPAVGYATYGHHMWRVERKADGAVIGMCGLIKRDTLEHVDVGYAFLPAYRGKGYAHEAAAASMAYGRQALGIDTIVAIVKPGNRASAKVLERLGLVYQRTLSLPVGDSDLYAPAA